MEKFKWSIKNEVEFLGCLVQERLAWNFDGSWFLTLEFPTTNFKLQKFGSYFSSFISPASKFSKSDKNMKISRSGKSCCPYLFCFK